MILVPVGQVGGRGTVGESSPGLSPGATKVLSGAALLLRMVPCRFTQRGIGRVGSHRLLAGDVPQSLDGWSLLWGSLRPHGEFI